MADIYEQLESRILLLDGGFGTMVQRCSRGATTCWP